MNRTKCPGLFPAWSSPGPSLPECFLLNTSRSPSSGVHLLVLLVVLQRHTLTAVVLQVVAGGDLRSSGVSTLGSGVTHDGPCGPHQSVGVVTHVPQRDQGQDDVAAVLSGDLVLAGHHRGHGPPVDQSLLVIDSTDRIRTSSPPSCSGAGARQCYRRMDDVIMLTDQLRVRLNNTDRCEPTGDVMCAYVNIYILFCYNC